MSQSEEQPRKTKNALFQCRMYEQEYPEVGDLVVVLVRKIEEIGAYVSLIEYGGSNGMVLLKELSRRKIKNINRFIRVGRCEVAAVICVDTEKGYIDLSKKAVTPEEAQQCEQRFAKSKTVHGTIFSVCSQLKTQPLDIYRSFAWPLYKIYGHAYTGFKHILNDEDAVFAKIEQHLENTEYSPVDERTRKELVAVIKQRYTSQKPKVRADIELTCFSQAGINAIKEALRAAEAVSTKAVEVRARLIAPPLYVLTLQSTEREEGLEMIHAALGKAAEKIAQLGGEAVVKMEPKVVNESDEKELFEKMKKSETENAEISGDDESE
ncbi:MAG: translation initiation factor eIF2 subunit alpha [Amphiamblys sp. WSBS2006]|nr:MAG: translation initiation factor eIF2 subunit alpha [Amphiamblys sp. WSBS2006]